MCRGGEIIVCGGLRFDWGRNANIQLGNSHFGDA